MFLNTDDDNNDYGTDADADEYWRNVFKSVMMIIIIEEM